MTDGYAVRFEDGPFAGRTTFLDATATWPPPEEIHAWESVIVDGVVMFDEHVDDIVPETDEVYRRVTYSKLDDDTAAHPNLMRGATYAWVPPHERS